MGVDAFVLAGRSGFLRDQPSEFIESRNEVDAMARCLFSTLERQRERTTTRTLHELAAPYCCITCFRPGMQGQRNDYLTLSKQIRGRKIQAAARPKVSNFLQMICSNGRCGWMERFLADGR